MSTQIQLGADISHEGDTWRVVRIVASDMSLFESEGRSFVIKESYATIKSPTGNIDHIIFTTEHTNYDGPTSTIKALEPLPWRKP